MEKEKLKETVPAQETTPKEVILEVQDAVTKTITKTTTANEVNHG